MARILIVDDDAGIRENLSETLGGEEHSVETAASGKEALKILEKEQFDIVLTDLIMPGIGGMQILVEVRRKSPKTQVVMITAFGTIENAVEAMKMGAADYITKPFGAKEIQVVVRRVLEELSFNKRLSETEVRADKMMKLLSSQMRRAVLTSLSRGELTFSEIMQMTNADDPTKLSFHLRRLKLSGLINQDEDKKYLLTPAGRRAVDTLIQLGLMQIY